MERTNQEDELHNSAHLQQQGLQPLTSMERNPLQAEPMAPTDTSRAGKAKARRRNRSPAAVPRACTLGFEPPRFTVDLSVKPEHRYDHIAAHMTSAVERTDLTGLFEDLVEIVFPTAASRGVVLALARRLLRRVYTAEETAELRGIARAAGMPLYLLVAFNVLLDLMLGCTSGGVRFREEHVPGCRGERQAGKNGEGRRTSSRLVHFRTLDWEMTPLRHLVVELDFVRAADGPVVATTVGYFGYVGVLTGVRAGLSVSLNFRPYHDRSTLRKRLSFRWHQILVVLGRRPSISSVLRSYLLDDPAEKARGTSRKGYRLRGMSEEPTAAAAPSSLHGVENMLDELAHSASTAAYLILCTPQRIYSLEKDNRSCVLRSDEDFLVTCNHDQAEEEEHESGGGDDEGRQPSGGKGTNAPTFTITCLPDLIDESVGRSQQATCAWRKLLERQRRKRQVEPGSGGGGESVSVSREGLTMADVLRVLGDRWIIKNMTQFAVVMDPESGTVLWRRAYNDGELYNL